MFTMAGTDLREAITDDLGKALAAEIDREVLWGLLEGTGWIRVKLSRYVDNAHAIDIRIWLEENRTNEVLQNGSSFLFKESKDATMFILRWADADRRTW